MLLLDVPNTNIYIYIYVNIYIYILYILRSYSLNEVHISLTSPHRCQAFCLTGFALVYMATVQQEAEQGACGAFFEPGSGEKNPNLWPVFQIFLRKT